MAASLRAPIYVFLILCIGTSVRLAQSQETDTTAQKLVQITSVSPTQGSLGGGTRLTITGTGFSLDRYAGGNVVLVGPYPCNVISHLSSDGLITCETTAGDINSYKVTVLVDGTAADSFCCFTYTSSLTPTFRASYPSAGPPGTNVSLYGDTTYQLNQDCTTELPTFSGQPCVGEITFGDYLCAFDINAPPSSLYQQVTPPRYNYDYSYQVNCSLPNPTSPVDAQVPRLGTARNVNVTVSFEGSLRGGAPLNDLRSYLGTGTGQLYQFQLYPVVDSISPADGSTAGGTLVTLTGRGFPNLALPLGDTVSITVQGVPCAVTFSNYTLMTCIMGAQPSGYTTPTSLRYSTYPGMRGLEWQWFNKTVVNFANLWALNSTITNVTTTFYPEVFESPNEVFTYSNWCSRSRAFFIAPSSNNYTFYATADDYIAVNGTWALSNGTIATLPLITSTSYTPMDSWFTSSSAASTTPVALSAGQAVLLEAASCNGASTGDMQVGVRIPSSVGTPASIAEVQTITVNPAHSVRKQTVKLLYASASTDTVYNVTITAPAGSEALLLSRRTGLTWSASYTGRTGYAFNTTASIAEADLATALANSLSNSPSTSQLGVSRWIIGNNTITYQIGLNGTRYPNFVITATLVQLPDPAAPTPANCTPFYPPVTAIPTVSLSPPSPAPPPSPPAPTYGAYGGSPPSPPAYPSPPSPSPFPPAPFPPSPPPSPSPNVLTVTVTSVTISGMATAPSGTWILNLPGFPSNQGAQLNYNDNGTVVSRAIAQLTGLTPDSVQTFFGVRDGGYLSNEWVISWPWSRGDAVPPLLVSRGTAPSNTIVALFDTSFASPAINGTLKLAWSNWCETITIDLANDDGVDIRQKMRSLPGLAAPPRLVAKSGSQEWGWTMTFTYDTQATPGDLPQIRITDTSKVSGLPYISVSTAVNGSSDIFLGPIPTELLRLPVSSPNTVSVTVNSVPAACSNASLCLFAWNSAKTPTITGVSPSTVNLATATTATLTITGTGFGTNSSALRIMVGSTPCNITGTVTATSLQCIIPDTTSGGLRTVQVYVDPYGYAAAATTGADQITVNAVGVTSVTPSLLYGNTTGGIPTLTMVNITGKGFDTSCANNRVRINGVYCGVVACTRTTLTALFPGSALGTSVPLIVDILQNATTNPTVRDTTTFTSQNISIVSTGVPFIYGLTSSFAISGAGGNVTMPLGGTASASNVTSAFMLPGALLDFSSSSQFDSLSSAFAKRYLIDNFTPPDNQTFNGTTVHMPNNGYSPSLKLSDGTTLVLGTVITASVYINNVSPAQGSIGGGTYITITGSGFSPILDQNVVLIKVPVSTTYLNGVTFCDPVSVSPTAVTCITRPNLAADASADDPNAKQVKPLATSPGLVQVVLCQSGLSDVLKLQCWSLAQNARSSCSAGGSCLYSFYPGATPTISSITPYVGQSQTVVTVLGTYLTGVNRAHLIRDGTTQATVSVTPLSDGFLNFTMPTLSAGQYQVLLRKINNEMSIDPNNVARFILNLNITSVSNNVGSLYGGLPLTINADTNSAGFNTTNMAANKVTIGGVPCNVTGVSSFSLQCIPGGMGSRIYAEYWYLTNTYFFPDVFTYTNPVATGWLNNGINALTWGSGSPDSAIPTNFWTARFSFVYQITSSQNYTFSLNVDDDARMKIDGVLVAPQRGTYTTYLQAGWHQFTIIYIQYTGSTYFDLQWDAGSGRTTFPWSQVFPFVPGTPQEISVTVNGVPANSSCSAQSNIAVMPSGQSSISGEASTVSIPAPHCAYLYSSYRTPTLTVPFPSTWPANNVVIGSPFAITGTLLGGSTDATQYSVSVNGVAGNVTSINGTGSLVTIFAALPYLPGGTWTAAVNVTGYGLARPPVTVPSAIMSITYNARVATIFPGQMSYYGGALLNITGYGFVPTSGTSYGKTMNFTVTNVGSGTAANFPATITWANATQMFVQLPRFYYNVSGPPSSFTFALQVIDSKGGIAKTVGTQAVQFGSTVTPTFPSSPNYTPSSLATATTGGNITMSWQVGSNPKISTLTSLFTAQAAGSASYANITLQSGANNITCASPAVLASTLTTSYSETTTCTLPSFIPASNYTVWLTAAGALGSLGAAPANITFSVPMTLTSANVTTVSIGGGLNITISGSGFGQPGDANVTLNGVPATIVSSTGNTLTFTAPSLAGLTTTSQAVPIIVTPTAGALPQTALNSVTVTYDATLLPTVTAVTPTRGSSAGGTNITFTASASFTGVASDYTIFIGAQNRTCTSVTLSSGVLSCITPAPGLPRPTGPVPVTILKANVGVAVGSITYEYADLWSRRTTWGGNDPPVAGDSVVIPPGVTVILDVSTPELYALVIQGSLKFDTSATSEIWLQAHYILVQGGNFSIGSQGVPYPGNARVTLYGQPNDIELPLYGAKVIAVRDGNAVFTGLPKTPAWTNLNATADVGATTITINGVANWAVGDRIVIASSSIYAEDVDERIITAITTNSTANTTTITVDSALTYTHLGVVVPIAGDSLGRVMDMRAEVACLTRNVILEGDPTTAATQYGFQIKVNTPSSRARAGFYGENILMRQSGQAFRLGSYTLHWHMHGHAAGQYLKGSVAMNTYNRAVTIHGTYDVTLQNNVAYNTMGHTFFLEDGIEQNNWMDGNLAILTRPSDALLNTDTTPACFWITNPNNNYTNNVGAGSTMGYGFWLQLQNNPTGPSATTTVCPKFMQLGLFKNNRAHSNKFYGLRVHPEFYPKLNPCGPDPSSSSFTTAFAQVPAVFDGLVSYKNGVKGAIATQVGLVQFRNMTLFDNGAGPIMHIVNGKDNGANMEMTWVVDDRNRAFTTPDQMAGLHNSILVGGRTPEGTRGTAGRDWNFGRKITGVIMHSPPQDVPKHSALASLINVTFVNYTGGQYYALEACGKCKIYQGGATTFTAGLNFIQPGTPAMSTWSWGHQGVFLDTDGTLLNNKTIPTTLQTRANFSLGQPGMTWHSAVDNNMFRGYPGDCAYTDNDSSTPRFSPNGFFCNGQLVFRRTMLHGHQPNSIFFKNIYVTRESTNTSAYVYFQHYNEDGYMFNIPSQTSYYIHWDFYDSQVNATVRVDPTSYQLHKIDPITPPHWLYISTKYLQLYDRITVNSYSSYDFPNTTLPNTTIHGAVFYNKTFVPDSWWYGNNTVRHLYNHTSSTVNIAGSSQSALNVGTQLCPIEGCNVLGGPVVDVRQGILYWSDPATWAVPPFNGVKPQLGQNVTIPYGWTLVVDENPPELMLLDIQGNVTFDTTKDVTLLANYILVRFNGTLWAGTPLAPHPRIVNILLNGTRQSQDMPFSTTLDLGAKVLAAVSGGTISLWGRSVPQRWVKLGATYNASSTTLVLSTPFHGWAVNQTIVVTSSTYNPQQHEYTTIKAIAADGVTLTISPPLTYGRYISIKSYTGARAPVDLRVEVAMVDSNIVISAVDGAATSSAGGEAFGTRVIVHGTSVGQFNNTLFKWCGQGALTDTASLLFQELAGVNGTSSNPSFVANSVFRDNLAAAIVVKGTQASVPTRITGSVFIEAYDTSMVDIRTAGNLIRGNLGFGLIKEMARTSSNDIFQPAVFDIKVQPNFVFDNVAAGSERWGYILAGPPCSQANNWFLNNTAHSGLNGMWLYASVLSTNEGCTGVSNFTSFLHWDFGLITMRGLATNLVLNGISIADSKWTGVLPLIMGDMGAKLSTTIGNSTFIGASRPDFCAICSTLTGSYRDPGCHTKLSVQSYNQGSPFNHSMALKIGAHAIDWTLGPEKKPYDGQHGYNMIHGITYLSSSTFADFGGSQGGCGGPDSGIYAMGNHHMLVDANYPMYVTKSNVINIALDGLFHLTGPDPGWRNEADCGFQQFTQPDGSILPLNCAGGKHAMIMDTDGTLTGIVGSVNGQYAGARSFPYDQGIPISQGPCVFDNVWQAYQCQTNSSVFTGNPLLKPNPMPPTGIFGDPQLFVLESRDADTEDRNFGPVMFNVSGVVDLVVAEMDQGWCFAYTCQKRLSNFWTYLPSYTTAVVNFTGTLPKVMRLYWPYAAPQAELVLVINSMGIPNRRFVYLDDKGRLDPLDAPPTIGDGTGHGAFYWSQSKAEMFVKMKGGAPLEIRQESAVAVSTSLALTVDQFYDTQATFLSGLAFVLGIELSRLKIVNVVPGSAQISYQIYDPPSLTAGPSTQKTFSTAGNLDSGSYASVAALPASQQAALLLQQLQLVAQAQAQTQDPTTVSLTASPPPPYSIPPPASPPPPLTAQSTLAAVVTALANAVASGALSSAIGVQVTGFAINLAGTTGLDPSVLAALTAVANQINSNSTITNGGVPLPPFPPRPPPSTPSRGVGGNPGGNPGDPSSPSPGVVGLSLPPPPPGAIVFNTPASNTKTVGGGAIAGIVVGAVVGCALLAGLALYVIKVHLPRSKAQLQPIDSMGRPPAASGSASGPGTPGRSSDMGRRVSASGVQPSMSQPSPSPRGGPNASRPGSRAGSVSGTHPPLHAFGSSSAVPAPSIAPPSPHTSGDAATWTALSGPGSAGPVGHAASADAATSSDGRKRLPPLGERSTGAASPTGGKPPLSASRPGSRPPSVTGTRPPSANTVVPSADALDSSARPSFGLPGMTEEMSMRRVAVMAGGDVGGAVIGGEVTHLHPGAGPVAESTSPAGSRTSRLGPLRGYTNAVYPQP